MAFIHTQPPPEPPVATHKTTTLSIILTLIAVVHRFTLPSEQVSWYPIIYPILPKFIHFFYDFFSVYFFTPINEPPTPGTFSFLCSHHSPQAFFLVAYTFLLYINKLLAHFFLCFQIKLQKFSRLWKLKKDARIFEISRARDRRLNFQFYEGKKYKNK